MNRNLSRLLRPKSIAVLGGAWAENVVVQLQKSGFSGDIWPIHPRRKRICGIPCFETIGALPCAPDASFVGVNRKLTIDIIRQLSRAGAGGAICFASGFAESNAENGDGDTLQNALVAAAGDMPIIGPNCYGLVNYLDNITLWPDQHGGRPCNSGVALIGQSSNILINMTMQKRALPLAYVLAVGNQAQTSLSDLALAALEDTRVTALGLYIESFGEIRKFEEMATYAHQLGKPVIAIKSGKSESARAATLTHTASLAGRATASSALLKRLGIVEVDSIAVFLETLKLLHVFGPLKGNAVSSMSCSGGEAGLIADMAADTNIHFRTFSPTARNSLKTILGSLVTISNPLDYHTFIWGEKDKLEATYSTVMKDGFDLNIIIMDIPPAQRCDMTAWQEPLQAAINAAQTTAANLAIHATLPENLSEEVSDRLIAHNIVPLHGMEEMIPAINAAIRAGEVCKYGHSPVFIAPAKKTNDASQTLDEASSKSTLSRYGISFPESRKAQTPDDIAKAAGFLDFPVALKGLGIAHKTERGAVVLDLVSADAVRLAAEGIKDATGYLVEEMITEKVAELIIGITRDDIGLCQLTIGAGGILTELMQDTISLLVPASRKDIAQAIGMLRVSSLLSGFRNQKAADMNAIVNAIESVQSYCLATPHLIELDINPLIALPEGAIAVDALIKLEKHS